jgi:hypothetical protein
MDSSARKSIPCPGRRYWGDYGAVRRELFAPIPAGTLLDDVYWPLRVAMTGARVIHDERAVAYDRLPERTADEFRRKVRTLAGNFQLAARLPAAFLPWRNPVWVQWWSHKLMRLIVPWALIGLFVTNAVLRSVGLYCHVRVASDCVHTGVDRVSRVGVN